jgi:hypothetical protein
MLMSVKVEKLVVSAIPDLVETWTKGFGFVPVGDIEKRRLKKLNLMVFPGTVLLEKSLYGKKKNEGIFIWCIWLVYYYKILVLFHRQQFLTLSTTTHKSFFIIVNINHCFVC